MSHHDPATCQDCRERKEFKATFVAGPWHDEPDRVDFESNGLPCFVNRGHVGCWCGYVGVPKGHAAYGLQFCNPRISRLKVHGGIDYASRCNGCLCHTPKPGESDDVWWFGFHCDHCGDLNPVAQKLYGPGLVNPYGNVYRDVDYITRQTKKLARQLAKMN